MERWAERVHTVRVIGTGVMGRGIAQLAAAAGITVELADARPEAIDQAIDYIGGMYDKLASKGRMTAEDATAAKGRLRPLADPLAPAAGVDLVIEAVREDLETKRELFTALEKVVGADTVLATNTSSLSVTSIGATLADPSRLAGLHFFNPVPLMRLVEVIAGARTTPWIPDALIDLVRRLGHQPVRAPDTPGFLVNHAGRGLPTEALQILAEGIAEPVDIDRIARDVLGLKMGPFELMDLTGLDVSHPVLETVWSGFYDEPRLRPSHITRTRMEAGLLGRKTGAGFYSYTGGAKQEPPEPEAPAAEPRPIWVDVNAQPDVRDSLYGLLEASGVEVERDTWPSDQAIVLVAAYGTAVVAHAGAYALPLERTFGIDPLGGFASRLTLAVHPGADPGAGRAALAALARTGRPVTVVRDAPGTVAQRLLASIVNVSCGIAEQHLARPEDIDTAVRLGLGYPRGPLEWGDHAGATTVLTILSGLADATGDPRYRPSQWLAERAELGLPLTATGTTPAALYR
ncbi:3-hydroxyacyl-CoA dehydrogenase [Actinomadura barringtoniae]|uniref:3-hydroxyacyl-CoA dehydrogenase n=2 Tax=Actinomadura barringtoniae TaxID=1427535 RepID=A0A939PAH1_9ACTN|nr:3-hydroxyacyl-CoA dehydrogenase [Actinomadura barringtoniae]